MYQRRTLRTLTSVTGPICAASRTPTPTGKRPAISPGDVAALAGVDLDALARVHEERHLHDGAGLERRGLRHVRDRVAAHGGLGLRHRQLHRGGSSIPEGLPFTASICTELEGGR